MLGWNVAAPEDAAVQLALDLGDAAPDPEGPAEHDPDDGLSWEEWFRSLPPTP